MTRTDIAITESLGASLDASGSTRDTRDADTPDPVVQRAILRAMNVTVPWYGEPITPEGAEAYRAAVETALERDGVIDQPARARIDSVARNTINLRVDVGERTVILDDLIEVNL